MKLSDFAKEGLQNYIKKAKSINDMDFANCDLSDIDLLDKVFTNCDFSNIKKSEKGNPRIGKAVFVNCKGVRNLME